VTFGAGKASQVIERVPLCPSNTFVSVNDWVILSGAKKGNMSFFILVLLELTHLHRQGGKCRRCVSKNNERCWKGGIVLIEFEKCETYVRDKSETDTIPIRFYRWRQDYFSKITNVYKTWLNAFLVEEYKNVLNPCWVGAEVLIDTVSCEPALTLLYGSHSWWNIDYC